MEKTSRCEYTGWIVAWIFGIVILLLLIDDIRISRIVVKQEKEIEECNYGR